MNLRSRAIVVFSFLASGSALAHVQTTDAAGNLKRWANPAPSFFANYININSLSASDIRTAITDSLSRWKYLGTASISFDYWQGSTTVSPEVSYNGRNTIFFQSQSSMNVGSGVIGVAYTYSTGQNILETDVILNDRDFTFTSVSTDTTNGNFNYKVYLENVLTHEFGHAYGLSHSNMIKSSMMWQEGKGQAKPSCDDANGMAAIYPNTAYTGQLGQISGIIASANGLNAVFGAYVHAISKRRGVTVATAISANTGAFTLQNLEPGEYNIMVEPFKNILNSLCGGSANGCYWGTSNAASVCSGSAFSRFFPSTVAGTANSYTVSSGAATGTGIIRVSCSAMTTAAANVSAVNFPNHDAVLSNASSGSASVYGSFSGVAGLDSHAYRLTNVSGNIRVKVLSHSLYSPADVTVSLLDTSGASVATESFSNVFPTPAPTAAPYPFIDYDSSVAFTNAPAGDYVVKINYASSLPSSAFPGPSGRDTTPFYLMVVTLNDATPVVLRPDNVAYLPENSRCERPDDFPIYPDNGTPSALSSSSASSSSSGGGGIDNPLKGGCGIIAARGLDRVSPGIKGNGTMSRLFEGFWRGRSLSKEGVVLEDAKLIWAEVLDEILIAIQSFISMWGIFFVMLVARLALRRFAR